MSPPSHALCGDGVPAAVSHLTWAARTDMIKWTHVPALCDNTQIFLRFATHFYQWCDLVLQGLLEKINSSEGWGLLPSNQCDVAYCDSEGLTGT